jgi:hypothetical protein
MRVSRWFVCTLFLAACAPDTRSGDDDGVAPDAATPLGPDAAPFIDAHPNVDGGSQAAVFTVYVHTKDKLYKLDPDTLAPVLVGSFLPPTADDITDLAVAPDDTIYCISKTKLYKADPDDGHLTYLSTLQSGPTAGNVGLTTLPDGKLLATDASGGVRSIDPATGQVHEIGALGGGLATAGDLVAVENGTMYDISDKGPSGDEYTNNWLVTVDPQTGAGTKVGQIGFGRVFGAAFVRGKVLAFTAGGDIVEVDPASGHGTLLKSTGLAFWGAGVSSLVPPVE